MKIFDLIGNGMKYFIVAIFLYLSVLYAKDPKELAKELALVPASKASVQWERIFKSERKLKRYKLDKLTKEQRDKLKKYLISHSADSDLPQYAGDV
jgi:hypothetical protein